MHHNFDIEKIALEIINGKDGDLPGDGFWLKDKTGVEIMYLDAEVIKEWLEFYMANKKD